MRTLTLVLVLTTCTVASAGSYEGVVVGIEPDKVVIQDRLGQVKSFTLSKTVKENKEPSRGYPLLYRELVVGQTIDVDSTRKDGVDEAQGFRFIAPPPKR